MEIAEIEKGADLDLINLFLGACISADNNLDNASRKINIQHLENFVQKVETGDFAASKDQVRIAKEGIKLLQKEIEENSEASLEKLIKTT